MEDTLSPGLGLHGDNNIAAFEGLEHPWRTLLPSPLQLHRLPPRPFFGSEQPSVLRAHLQSTGTAPSHFFQDSVLPKLLIVVIVPLIKVKLCFLFDKFLYRTPRYETDVFFLGQIYFIVCSVHSCLKHLFIFTE